MLNKNYKKGAEDMAKIAGDGFSVVGEEIKGAGRKFEENARAQHNINEGIFKELEKIAYGFSDNGKALETMSGENKILLIGTLKSIKDASKNPSDAACKYYEFFYAILGANPLSFFNPDKLFCLDQEEAEYTLYVLLEYRAFFEDDGAKLKANELIDCIKVAPKRCKEFEESVKETIDDVGFGGILRKYRQKAMKEENERLKRENEAYRERAEKAESEAREAKQKEEEQTRKKEEKKNHDKQSTSDLYNMERKANKAVATAVATAAGVGAAPIPLADFPILIGTQITLMASIAAIFQINIKKDGLRALALAAFGVSGGAVLGKTIVTSLLKAIPGVGQIVGGVISATTAGAITLGMGKSFIELCKAIKRGELKEDDISSHKGKSLFKKLFKKTMKTQSSKE